MSNLTVVLQPAGRRVEVAPGTSLLEAAQKAGIELVASCGGIGICGTCRVRVVQGRVTPPDTTEIEELGRESLAAGFRLACQTIPLEDVRVDIPRESLVEGQRVQVEGQAQAVALDPPVAALDCSLPVPHLGDLRSDMARVDGELAAEGLPALTAGPGLLAALSTRLRENGWKARLAVRRGPRACELAAALPPGAPLLGLAMDLGSTKLACYLLDLESGATLAQSGVMNPQISFGEDVVARIAFANRAEENRRLLQTRLVETLNSAVAGLCLQAGVQPGWIAEITAVGNTAMHHLFCGLPVEPLGRAPYVAVVSSAIEFAPAEIGLIAAPGARVYMPPNIAGYVGADHVAALLAAGTYAAQRPSLLVDIGTNTEISLSAGGQLLSCSCASGPAFEGAHIRDGMRAAPGAIERVHIHSGEVRPVTIGGQPPVGICGSGILNAVAELLREGVIDGRGVMQAAAPGVRRTDGRSEFVLVPAQTSGNGRDILVTRKDVNEIQLAKGAIRAGIEVLLREANLPAGEIEEFTIAGAFGTHLDLDSALAVGMFPRLPRERFHQVGNAAGVGARHLLLSRAMRHEADVLAGQVKYIELTTDTGFTPLFVDSMYFGG